MRVLPLSLSYNFHKICHNKNITKATFANSNPNIISFGVKTVIGDGEFNKIAKSNNCKEATFFHSYGNKGKILNPDAKRVLNRSYYHDAQKIDDAVKRSGRIDKKLYVAPPDHKTRLNLLKIYTKGRPLSEDVNFEFIARSTHNYATSDIKAIAEQAVRNAARHKEKISTRHFDKALSQIRPSLNEAKIQYYKNNGEDIEVNIYD